jgi:spore germination cell wall hydrolase CwlJ-like protein
MAVGTAVLMGSFISAPTLAGDVTVATVEPAQITPALEAQRMQPVGGLRPGFSAPALTNDLLAAYVQKQQSMKSFTSFDVQPSGELNEAVLLGYIDRTKGAGTKSLALDAIDSIAEKPALNADLLETYAHKKFMPTVKKVKLSASERLCLTQAIYHEARGESETGQWAVANVIINRAMSHKFPTSLCGVVFQNADQGFHHCQFTFACDGRSDMGTEQGAWNRAQKMAAVAYKEYQEGDTPGVVPRSALYYHTTAVNPGWSNRFKRVAAIGAHVFYATN